MTPSRIVKSIARRAMVSWREQPTQQDIEALQANIARVGLVIRIRWSLVAALALFSVLGGSVYLRDVRFSELLENMLVPAVALVFVLAYNTFYQATYRRLGNIAFLNHAQLLFDMVVATVLIHYSGGVYSWFATIYLLIILEGAFILPNRRHVWFLALASAVMYGSLVWSEYLGLLAHVDMPFVGNELARNPTFVAVRYLWQLTVMFGTAMLSTLLVSSARETEDELRSRVMLDARTGLYNRRYFQMALAREVERAQRTGCSVSVILVDINQFTAFNELFGIDAGDRMLCAIADAARSAVDASAGARAALDTVCRYGGEEFAAIVADSGRRSAERRDPLALAQDLRERVAALRVDGGSVTVSVGMAAYPRDADSPERLLSAADAALSAATAEGGNRVIVASGGAEQERRSAV
ncbi:MAG: GGDEF domain-containing protein [Coriobacteriia bacterium]|nr:GGDEF domain-containing protein [Coriobacteriia bacterium]